MSQLLRLKHKNFRAYNGAFQNSVSQGNHELIEDLKDDLKDLGLQKSVSQGNHELIKDLMDRGLDNQGNVHGSTFSVCITHVKNDILLHKKAIQCKITSITVSSQRTLGKLQATIFKSLFFPHFLSYLIFTTELHVMSVAAANTVFCAGLGFFCNLLVSKGIAKDVAHVPLYVVPNH